MALLMTGMLFHQLIVVFLWKQILCRLAEVEGGGRQDR